MRNSRNTIRLEALGITAKIPPFMEYHDHGFVDDLEDYRKKILEMERGEDSESLDLRDANGICSTFATLPGDPALRDQAIKSYADTGFPPIKLHFHIAYLQRDDPANNIFSRGHEEGHVLHMSYSLLGDPFLIDALEDKICREQKARIDLRSIGDKELVANIAGIYAMRRRNLDFFQLSSELMCPEFVQAVSIYSRALND